ncbi:L,D-transpeptidase family protein [Mucilaginibacter sp. BT774]|uniref:L,D-transpeptidase family protein n=1 Tax=Mucilaginibacter sp. BT774 TaxID=3062276 RepID=UPI002676A8DB|nr:L,D-transpeptidase family protein [Mucilaginibacter sp. BT774]MDO3625866.1 L,D-transpeptidase family protein [Mucilaginibacter sp. BT774]
MNLKNICLWGALLLLIVLTACNQPQNPAQQETPTTSKSTDTSAKTDPAPDTDRTSSVSKSADTTTKINRHPSADQQALTLPVLDALFYEPGFAKELKSRLGLPAAKIAQLRTAAHASIKELSEQGNPDTLSARSATERYQQRIKALIGERKMQELLQLVNQRYSQGVEGLSPTQPNFVPKDTRIVVNVPAFRMDVFEKGMLIKTYKIGIGYPEFPLPAGMRRADTVIFNPSWTPPDEPWVRGKFAPGRKVSAANKLNPLGLIKIPIGKPSLIHGGKPPEKIGHFASHGCVGLTNKQVLDLVPIILRLGQSGLSAKAVRSLEKHKGKTKFVKLPEPIPVDLRYETIVAENGGLRVYRDVYERSTNTVENAKAVLAAYDIKYEQLSATEQSHLEAALAEMNRDAHGRQIAAADSLGPSKDGVPASKLARAKKGKVTSKVKGHTDILVRLAALQGKGYPAPVALDYGRKK